MITGDEIRDGRQLLGLTQAELAAQIGVSFRTVGNWERGETSPQRYEARLRKLFVGHGPAPSKSIEDFGDTELLLEVSRRMNLARSQHDHTAAQSEPVGPASSVEDRPVVDGSMSHLSDRRPRIVSDDVNDDVLELPYAADEDDGDPGEDDQ